MCEPQTSKVYFGSIKPFIRKKGDFAPYPIKKNNYMNSSYIPRGYTQVLSKMPFFILNEAMELQKIVFRRKDLTLIYIYDIIFFSKEKYI